MEHYVGIDVSLKESSVCVVDAAGKLVREVKVASEPEALIQYFAEIGLPMARIGLEAGPLSQWLHTALVAAGRDVVLLETRHVKAALSAMKVKTDRKDARGIAQLLRMGWYRPVHAKSSVAQDTRALLVGRKLLQGKLLDVELSIRGIRLPGRGLLRRLARDLRAPQRRASQGGLRRNLPPRPQRDDMSDRPYNALFLCTGNSCRSILAEAVMNRLGNGRFKAFSAGSHPFGQVNPHALRLLKRMNHPVDGLRSKPWDEFSRATNLDAPKLDFVFTVCDNAAGEVCPIWPGRPMSAHWGLPDPAAFEGSMVETALVFADTYRMLNNRIGLRVKLPIQSLDKLSLQNRLDQIGKTVGEPAPSA